MTSLSQGVDNTHNLILFPLSTFFLGGIILYLQTQMNNVWTQILKIFSNNKKEIDNKMI